MAQEALDSGHGLDYLKRLVEAQGGDVSVIDHPDKLPQAPIKAVIEAPQSGYVHEVHARRSVRQRWCWVQVAQRRVMRSTWQLAYLSWSKLATALKRVNLYLWCMPGMNPHLPGQRRAWQMRSRSKMKNMRRCRCFMGWSHDFNGWDQRAEPMKKKKDGTFYTALTLNVGRSYEFRYLLDQERWENDWSADAYSPNEMGTENSVIEV
jgi:hypothetical protein